MVTDCLTNKVVQGILQGFGSLDNTIGDTFAATSSLNTRLEKLSVQHEKSMQSSFLINCYLAFYRKGNCLELERLWESNNSLERRKCANVVRQLQSLSRKIGFKKPSEKEFLKNGDLARDGIDKFAEMLERDLLNDFDNAYRSADLAAMKDSADTLTDFNGGGSVIQMFVNQHDYFIVREKLVDTSTAENEQMWAELSDPDGDSVELDNAIQALVDEIREVIVTEMEIIKKVFKNAVAILKVFLQRVFAQRIQQQVETYLMLAESKSTLAYMRTLHLCYSKIGSLTKSLKDTFAGHNADEEGELAALLEANFSDIFVPYIENGKYFEAEIKNLTEIIASTLTRFTDIHTQKLHRDHSILSRFTSHAVGENLAASSSSHNLSSLNSDKSSSSDDKGQGRIGQFMRAVRLERSNSSQSKNPENDEQESAEPDVKLDDVQKILKCTAESVKRDLELADPSQIPKDAEAFLHLLLETIGRDVVEVLLDEAVASSTNQASKNIIDLSFLKTVRQVTSFIYLISSMVKTVILPMLAGNSVLRQATISAQNDYIQRCETKMNTIIQNAIDLCMARIVTILGKQKKKDYVVKSSTTGGGAFSSNTPTEVIEVTPTCIEVSHFLEQIHTVAVSAFDSENLESFLLEVGTGFKNLLLDHFKKYNVNSVGGLVVSKDIQHYQESIDMWSVSDLSELFSILHNISNLFTAQPDAIKSLVRGSSLAQVKTYLVKEYLMRRVDYFTAGINRIFVSSSMPEQRTMPLQVPMYPMM